MDINPFFACICRYRERADYADFKIYYFLKTDLAQTRSMGVSDISKLHAVGDPCTRHYCFPEIDVDQKVQQASIRKPFITITRYINTKVGHPYVSRPLMAQYPRQRL